MNLSRLMKDSPHLQSYISSMRSSTPGKAELFFLSLPCDEFDLQV